MDKTEREALGAQLVQNAIDLAAALKALDAERVRLEGLLKPELRHLDYGYCDTDRPFIMVQSKIRNKLEYANRYGLVQYGSNMVNPTIVGNLDDDLKRNSEDLEEFSVDGVYRFSVKKRMDSGWVVNCDQQWLDLEDVIVLHQKLGQLIATQKRRK